MNKARKGREVEDLIEELRSEAEIADRPGQFDRLNALADEFAAEIEALRAEVERFRTDGASAVRWAPSSAYWSEVLKELFGPNASDGIYALEARWRAELERADTAEALLRQVLEVWDTLRSRKAVAAIREYLGGQEWAKPSTTSS